MNMLAIFFVIIGVTMFLHGILKMAGIVKEDISKDSEFDKKHLSEKSRYFIGRYWAGSQAIIAGIGAIGLGLILYFSIISR